MERSWRDPSQLVTAHSTCIAQPIKAPSTFIAKWLKFFLRKTSTLQKYVIHVNHNKLDNKIKNLKWATLEQMIEHQQDSPAKKAYKVKQANRTEGLKLTAPQVRKIKAILHSRKRAITIRQLAEQFGVSEMTMYRIKSGENWGRV